MTKLKKLNGKFGAEDYMDLALVESIKRGHQESFTMLYNKYHKYLHRKIFFALRNKYEVDDVVSEIFQKIYENINQYQKDYTFNAWISTLSHNYMIDYIRKNKRRTEVCCVSLDEPINNPDSDVSNSLIGDLIPYEGEIVPHGMIASEDIERTSKLKVTYTAIENLTNISIDTMPVTTGFIFKKFHYDYKTPDDISSELNIGLKEVEDHIKKGYEYYDRAELEKHILKMYLFEQRSYQEIAKAVNMNLNSLRVTLKRAKEKVVKSINVQKALIEVAGIYTLEQLRLEEWYLCVNTETK